MKSITIPISLTHPAAQLPAQSHGPSEDAGYDLCLCEAVEIHLGETKLVGTGVSVEIPSGVVGLLCSRSGLSTRQGVRVANQPAVIDPGYRGEILIPLEKFKGPAPASLEAGTKVAQIVFVPYYSVNWELSTVLTSSKRGKGGFGSTGMKS